MALELLELEMTRLELKNHRERLGGPPPSGDTSGDKYISITVQVREKRHKIPYALWNLVEAEALLTMAKRTIDTLSPEKTINSELLDWIVRLHILECKLDKMGWVISCKPQDPELVAEHTKFLADIDFAHSMIEGIQQQYSICDAEVEAITQFQEAQSDVTTWVAVCGDLGL